MVSRRNFATIVIMFLILFFMFQFSGVMKDKLNHYGSNAYVKKTTTSLTEKSIYQPTDTQDPDLVFIGEKSSAIASVVSSYAEYTKQTLAYAENLQAYEKKEQKEEKLLILDGTCVTTKEDVSRLEECAKKGITIIFASMPSYDFVASSEELQQLMGISQAYEKEVKLKGMHLFSGFLLGGEALYEVQTPEDKKRQDLNVTIPWYVTGSGTKTYMVGTISDQTYHYAQKHGLQQNYLSGETDKNSIKNNLLPAVIWRNSVGTSKVFCVNEDFLSDDSGVGILSAIEAENGSYVMYPVVNAQNLVVADYPAFVSENEKEMQKLYSQSASAVYQDILWPSIASLAEKTDSTLTCMMTPQFSYSDKQSPDGTNVSYYLKLLNEQKAEAGISGVTNEDLNVNQKLSMDQSFWKTYAPDYQFLSLYVKDALQMREALQENDTQVKTVAVGESSQSSPAFGYVGENLTFQYATDQGVKHTFLQDFQLRCRETAVGYSNIILDLYRVTYPQSKADSWQILSKKISSNVATYWKPFVSFDHTTLSESDMRIRRFLALDDQVERDGKEISLTIHHFEKEAFFLLRLHGEKVVSVTGGSASQIEDGSYLITAKKEKVSIMVEETEKW